MESMSSDFLQSSEQFREMFDRNHPSFHGGDPKAVGLGNGIYEGGQEVILGHDHYCVVEVLRFQIYRSCTPEISSEAAVKVSALLNERSRVIELKEGLLDSGKFLGMASGQQHVVRCDQEAAKEELQNKLKHIGSVLDLYKETAVSATKHDVISTVEEILGMSQILPVSKDAYGDFLLRLNRSNSVLSRETRRLLAEVKVVKQQQSCVH